MEQPLEKHFTCRSFLEQPLEMAPQNRCKTYLICTFLILNSKILWRDFPCPSPSIIKFIKCFQSFWFTEHGMYIYICCIFTYTSHENISMVYILIQLV